LAPGLKRISFMNSFETYSTWFEGVFPNIDLKLPRKTGEGVEGWKN
jgi:hypothetical protein